MKISNVILIILLYLSVASCEFKIKKTISEDGIIKTTISHNGKIITTEDTIVRTVKSVRDISEEVVEKTKYSVAKPLENTKTFAEPVVSISASKMNVLYVGVDNPVDISVVGVSNNNIFPSITNGSIIRGRNYFIVRPRRPGNSIITVSAIVDEQRKRIGLQEFRVRSLPDPIAFLAGKKGGRISKNILLAQSGIIAEIENFEFDARFRVTQFTVSAAIRGFVQECCSNSNKFTIQQKDLIKNLRRRDKIYIEDIKAVGPDGVLRKLPPMVFRID